ncbi:HupE/UreJ family protein [Novosphingobium sp.]|uniref:HupE/UreJ family protein n=1 Tax=Novosphingobium sp. TaxID=1874826 RepID=UPI0025F48713|nr:HupE/UreJ family protein [Novosphingobium sp.]
MAAAIVLLCGSPAAAHLTPNSEVQMAIGHSSIRADVIVPQGEYAFATGNPVSNDARSLDLARAYLEDRSAILAPDGRRWLRHIESIAFAQIAGPPDLHVVEQWTPPPGAPLRRFTIDWHVLVDALPNHFALFLVSSDVANRVGAVHEVIGAVRRHSARLVVDRGGSSALTAFTNAVMVGVDHILGGYDHLMFLLALLLPASLIASGGRWVGLRPMRKTIGHLARIVTAFTIGHSVTLIGATLGHWHLPSAPVEVMIAISVLVSAIHAIRPLAPGREPLIALIFGLIHGLAFATIFAQAGAAMGSGALGLAGVNLGIEMVQLGIVLVTVPALLVLASTPAYPPIRIGAAAFACLAALAWIVNRTTGELANLVAALESAMSHAGWLIALLSIAALTVLVSNRLAIAAAHSGKHA